MNCKCFGSDYGCVLTMGQSELGGWRSLNTRVPYWFAVFYDECKIVPIPMSFVDNQTDTIAIFAYWSMATTTQRQSFDCSTSPLVLFYWQNYRISRHEIRTMCIHMLPLIVSENDSVGGAIEERIRRSNEWLCVAYKIMYHIELFTSQPNIWCTYSPTCRHHCHHNHHHYTIHVQTLSFYFLLNHNGFSPPSL